MGHNFDTKFSKRNGPFEIFTPRSNGVHFSTSSKAINKQKEFHCFWLNYVDSPAGPNTVEGSGIRIVLAQNGKGLNILHETPSSFE